MVKPESVGGRIRCGLAVAVAVASVAVAAADLPSAGASHMRRLTDEQYRNAIADIFGEDIEFAGRFDPLAFIRTSALACFRQDRTHGSDTPSRRNDRASSRYPIDYLI